MSNLETGNNPLAGQVAIVTGGGRGIGSSIAQTLSRAGAKIAVAARTRDQLEETVALIQKQGGQAIAFTLDVTDQLAVEQMVSETERQFGSVDLLVNNAGVSGEEALLWEMDAVNWWHVMEVNLRGPFLCAHAVLPGMVSRQRGRIINVSSGVGTIPFALNSGYVVSKAALFRLTDCLAEMTSTHGVSVFAISPGLVRTAMTQDMTRFKDVPDDKWVPVERAGELCVFLATGKADRLSGRYLHVLDDITELVQRTDEILENDLYALRLRKLSYLNMEHQVLQPLAETIKMVVQELYTAIEHKDLQRMGELVTADVFVFGAGADAVSIGRDQFVTDLRSQFERVKDAELRLQSSEIQVGLCASGRSAWFLDRLVIEIAREQEILYSYPIRITGLIVLDQDWQLTAAYWSIPLRSNEYQYSLIQGGKIHAGVALEGQVAPEAQPLAQSLIRAMAQPHFLPEMYATREDAFTIGSTVDEVFLAAEGNNWVQQIVQLPLQFAIRGGIHSVVAPDGCTAWMATHIDLNGGLTMPYRFFFVWLREQDEWKIVVSHDAVSVDPFNPGFDAP